MIDLPLDYFLPLRRSEGTENTEFH
jgi:hypothetical protein